MSRIFHLPLLAFVLALVAITGCHKPSPPSKYSYDQSNLSYMAASFLEDPPAKGMVTDDKVPLTFLDLDGKKVELTSFRDKANVVLVVTKGMPQSPGGVFCPGCLAQMNALVANLEEFKKRQAEILVVFPGPSEKASEFLSQAKAREADKPSPIPLLLDKDSAAVGLLGIRGDYAKPATYLLNRKGNVVFAYVGEGTTDRPSVKALLNQLDKVNAKK